jgi:hypothetical protein
VRSLTAKYDKTLARLAEDRRAVAADEAEAAAEAAAVADARRGAAAAAEAAAAERAQLLEQVGPASERQWAD